MQGERVGWAVGRRREEMERLHRGDPTDVLPTRTEDAIGVAVCAAAELMAAPLIVCFTSSGFTARTVASYRPSVPIFAVTSAMNSSPSLLHGDPALHLIFRQRATAHRSGVITADALHAAFQRFRG